MFLREITALADLPKNASVGVIRASFLAETLAEYKQVLPSYTHNTTVLVAQLFRKRVDYVLEETIPFVFFSREQGYASTFTDLLVVKENAVCSAFSKKFFGDKTKDIALKANTIIKQLKAVGFIEQILNKYIGNADYAKR